MIFMDKTSFVYNKSFEVSLTFCEVCKTYYNTNEIHKCNNTPTEKVDIIEQMMENTRPKEKSKKRKET